MSIISAISTRSGESMILSTARSRSFSGGHSPFDERAAARVGATCTSCFRCRTDAIDASARQVREPAAASVGRCMKCLSTRSQSASCGRMRCTSTSISSR
eukprot:scaffold4501_cov108-Isochrysis_galbana.AAC.8